MDALVRPFPNELTTPPVTKICFVILTLPPINQTTSLLAPARLPGRKSGKFKQHIVSTRSHFDKSRRPPILVSKRAMVAQAAKDSTNGRRGCDGLGRRRGGDERRRAWPTAVKRPTANEGMKVRPEFQPSSPASKANNNKAVPNPPMMMPNQARPSPCFLGFFLMSINAMMPTIKAAGAGHTNNENRPR